MKLCNIRLKNFLSWKETSVDLSKTSFAVISGQNGAGKSALFIDAVLFALFNQCRSKKTDEIVSHGADFCEVVLDFEFLGEWYTIQRMRGKNANKSKLSLFKDYVDISGDTQNDTQAKIISLLGLSSDVFLNSAIVSQGDADRFLMAPPAARFQLLSDVMKLRYWQTIERKAADKEKSALLQLSYVDQTLASSAVGLLSPEQTSEIKDRQVHISEELVKADAVISSYQPSQRGFMGERIKQLQNELISIQSRMEQAEGNMSRYSVQQTAGMIESMQDDEVKIVEFDNKIHNLMEEAAMLSARQQLGNLAIAQIKDTGKCPVCQSKIKGKTILKTLEETGEMLNTDLQIANESLLSWVASVGSLRQSKKTMEDKLASMEHSISSLLKEKQMLRDQVVAVEEQLSKLQGEYDKLPVESYLDIKLIQKQRDDLLVERTRLENALINNDRSVEEYKGLQAKRDELASEAACLSYIKKAFGRAGVVGYLIASMVTELEQSANALLMHLAGGKFSIQLKVEDNNFNVTCRNNINNAELQAELLSGGERFRVSLALRLAICSYLAVKFNSKIKFLIVDELESLDTDGVEKMLQYATLPGMQYLEQILIISHLDSLTSNGMPMTSIGKVNIYRRETAGV